MKGKSIVAALLVFIAAYWGWQKFLQIGTLTEGTATRENFFRLKADYTYKSADGPIPWTFDVVARCGVQVTKDKAAGLSYLAGRSPTIVAMATPDGKALAIQIPRVCGNSTTENGWVPKDFFPAVVYYESSTDLSLGELYLSEDAYERPSSKLIFHGATVSSATRAEFDKWPEGEGRKNLVPLEASSELSPVGFTHVPMTEEEKQNPGMFWKVFFPSECYGVNRIKMSDEFKQRIRPQRNPGGPRYWSMSTEDTLRLMSEIGGEFPKLKINQNTYNAHRFLFNDKFGLGLLRRNHSGTTYAAAKSNGYLPGEYFPLRHDFGLPWIKNMSPQAKSFTRELTIGDEAKKGIFYCYLRGGSPEINAFFAPQTRMRTDGPGFVSGIFNEPADLIIDGQNLPKHFLDGRDTGSVFFDRDEYILKIERIQL